MKCPQLHHLEFEVGQPYKWVLEDCLKEECAWWDVGLEECSILILQQDISWIAGTLMSIETKMPQVEK